MILRWLICFSLAAGLAAAATVSGSIALKDAKAQMNRKEKDLSGVVVSLVPANAPATVAGARHATMLQKNKMFTPHVLAIEAGTHVDFPNADPIFHNAFSSYNGQVFDVGLYPPGSTRSIRFVRAGVVRVFCNIHSSMSAIIVVLDTPYFATTGRDGKFSLQAPPGNYELRVFHERATDDTLQRLSRPITVAEGGAIVGPITISEAGHLSMPHKNKYGMDYPPPPDDSFYPGARK